MLPQETKKSRKWYLFHWIFWLDPQKFYLKFYLIVLCFLTKINIYFFDMKWVTGWEYLKKKLAAKYWQNWLTQYTGWENIWYICDNIFFILVHRKGCSKQTNLLFVSCYDCYSIVSIVYFSLNNLVTVEGSSCLLILNLNMLIKVVQNSVFFNIDFLTDHTILMTN